MSYNANDRLLACQRCIWLLILLALSNLSCKRDELASAAMEATPTSNRSIEKVAEVSADGAPPAAPSDTTDAARLLLNEVTAEVGLIESEAQWPDGVYLTPEITPGGVALLDFDNDGDLDIYQICHCAPAPMPGAFRQPAPNRLFRQDDGKFVEVAAAAGADDPGYGHGAAVGDIDNDGDLDLYVTNFGPNSFFLNNGDGTFSDRTRAAGFNGDYWSSAAAFFDYDRDGDLDLIVIHFAKFDPTRRCSAGASESELDYCGPHLFDGLQDQLYRNNGDGTFSDVSAEAGITAPARGWGVIATDLTGDGLPDIYVCNDEEPNQLWVNAGDGTFMDEAIFRGVAFNGMGRAEASMGVTLGDVDNNQTLDLFMTHVTSETNTLYTLEAGDLYNDSSSKCGTAAVDLPYTGWGCGMFDLDHDGDLDLAVANGRVAIGTVDPKSKQGEFWNRYAEPNLLFVNDGTGRFTDVSARGGRFCSRHEVTRGLALGDLDNDGDIDLVTNDLANRLRVFRSNASANAHHWLQVQAEVNGRAAIGAMLTLRSGEATYVRPLLRSYSYLASNDARVHFGLGDRESVDELTIRWPDGSVERFEVLAVDCLQVVRFGEGQRE